MDPLIIIGTGLAGYNLAKEVRKQDAERPLVLLTEDDGRNYSKPMLSTGFTKNKTADELAMADAATMAQQLSAEVLTEVSVQALDREARMLTLSNGEQRQYSQLVLACGAEVFRPPLAGDAADAVYSVNDLRDYATFRQALEGKRSVAIIGGGLIGCEFANDLTNGGFAVQVIEPLGRPLPTLLPPEASAAVAAGLGELGVQFHYDARVTEINHGADGQLVLSLSDGQSVSADMVVSAVGLKPRTALAEQAGLAVNRGVRTDRWLRTSDPHIFALGDCAEVEGFVMLYVLPLMAGARALAKTLCGTDTPVAYGSMPVVIKTPACPVVVAPVPQGVAGEWQIEGEGADIKALFHDADGTLRGFALTGAATAEKNTLGRSLPPLLA